MITDNRKRFSGAHVMAALALFVALGGSAIATVSRDEVKSKHVKDNGLKSKDLKDGKAVTGADVVDDSLAGADIDESTLNIPQQAFPGSLPPSGPAGGALTGTYPNPELANGVVTAAKIADGAVGAAHIADGAIGSGQLAADAVDSSKIGDGTVTGNDLGTETVTGANIDNGTVFGQDLAGDTVGRSQTDEASLAGACANGWVRGYALVKGDPTMPNTFTSAPAYVDHEFNCTGQPVEVRRVFEGVYCVHFVNNNSVGAWVSSPIEGHNGATDDGDSDNHVGAERSGLCSSDAERAFDVLVTDAEGGAEEGWFYILIM